MLRILVALGLLWPATARAQQPYVFTPIGVQQYSSLATATPLTVPTQPPAPGPPKIIEICVEGAAVRYRDDGTAPTSSVGIPVAAGTCFQYAGNIAAIQFIQQSSGAVIDVSYYR